MSAATARDLSRTLRCASSIAPRRREIEAAPVTGLGRHPLILAAHPDDETLGAGALIGRFDRAFVAHVTDGAPRDRELWPASFDVSRERYAELRREEATRAMVLAGILPTRVRCLGFVDQEVAFEVPALVQRLCDLFVELVPDVVVCQPYEGGHPDHDAVALAARAAALLLDREGAHAPRLFEMTSYHGEGGCLTALEFLPAKEPVTTLRLTAREQVHKRAMLDCFGTQAEVLAAFPVEVERFRPAPRADFSRPPHDGPLFYEQLGWPMSGARFRALARLALEKLDLPEDPWR